MPRDTTHRRPAGSSPEQQLLDLPAEHPYRAVATGAFTPQATHGSDTWRTALPLVLAVLAADANLPSCNPDTAAHRRGALCTYLDWLAATDPRFLELPAALADIHINRYLASDGRQRRSSHRSRVALRSQIRSYRAAYPALYQRQRKHSGKDQILQPLEDWQLSLAYESVAAFRSPATRVQLRAMLLLCRGAGLAGRDLRWITGQDIYRHANAGAWVRVTTPAAPRQVPILAQYAAELEDLATCRPTRAMIAAAGIPTPGNQASQLCGQLNRLLARTGHTFTVSPEKLRKAWLAEHLGANTPINTILLAAGLRSLRTLETLVETHAPSPPTNPQHLAYELGALTHQQIGRE